MALRYQYCMHVCVLQCLTPISMWWDTKKLAKSKFFLLRMPYHWIDCTLCLIWNKWCHDSTIFLRVCVLLLFCLFSFFFFWMCFIFILGDWTAATLAIYTHFPCAVFNKKKYSNKFEDALVYQHPSVICCCRCFRFNTRTIQHSRVHIERNKNLIWN